MAEVFFHTPELPIGPATQDQLVPPSIILVDKYDSPVYPQLSDYGKSVLMSIVNYGGVVWTPGYIKNKLTYDELQGYVSGKWKPFANLLLSEAPKEIKDNPYARNRRFTVDPRSRSVVIDNGLNRLRSGPWLNSGREPWREWGPFYSNLDRSTTWICCGRPVKDGVNNGCWKDSRKRLVRYDFMPAIRSARGEEAWLADLNSMKKYWQDVTVGTPWVDYDYYTKLDQQIKTIKNTPGLMEFVRQIKRRGIDHFDTNPALASTLARLYVLENEYNEVHGSYRWFQDFGQPEWIDYMAKDLNVLRTPVAPDVVVESPPTTPRSVPPRQSVPSTPITPSVSTTSDSTPSSGRRVLGQVKKRLRNYLNNSATGLDEGLLKKLFDGAIGKIEYLDQEDAITNNIAYARGIQDTIKEITDENLAIEFNNRLQSIFDPDQLPELKKEVNLALLEQGDIVKAIAAEKDRTNKAIPRNFPYRIRKLFASAIDDPTSILLDMNVLDALNKIEEWLVAAIEINNLITKFPLDQGPMRKKFTNIRSVSDIPALKEAVITEYNRQTELTSRMKNVIETSNLPPRAKEKLLNEVERLSTEAALDQLAIQFQRELEESADLLKLIEELPGKPQDVIDRLKKIYLTRVAEEKDFTMFINSLKVMEPVIEGLPNATTGQKSLRDTFYDQIMVAGGFQDISKIVEEASTLQAEQRKVHRSRGYDLNPIPDIKLPTDKDLPEKFGLKWDKNSCWIDSALVMLFGFRNTSLVREVASARSITLFPENKVYKFGGIEHFQEVEDCNANEFQRGLLTDIYNLQTAFAEPVACTLRPMWRTCLPVRVQDNDYAEPLAFIESMKQVYDLNSISYDFTGTEGSLDENKPFHLLHKIPGMSGDDTYPLELGNFVRIAVIASQMEGGSHFVTLLRHPKGTTTRYINFTNGATYSAKTQVWAVGAQETINGIPDRAGIHFAARDRTFRYQHVAQVALYIRNDDQVIADELGVRVKPDPEPAPGAAESSVPNLTNRILLNMLEKDAQRLRANIQNLTDEEIQRENYQDIDDRVQLVLQRVPKKGGVKTEAPTEGDIALQGITKDPFLNIIDRMRNVANIPRYQARKLFLTIKLIQISQRPQSERELSKNTWDRIEDDIDRNGWIQHYFDENGDIIAGQDRMPVNARIIYPILEQIETDPDYRLSDTQYHWDKIYEDLIDPLSDSAEIHQDKIEDIDAFARMGVHPRGRLEEESLPLHFQTKYLHAMSVIGQMLHGLEQGQEQVDDHLKARIDAEWPAGSSNQ